MGMKQQSQDCTRCSYLVPAGGYAYPIYVCSQGTYYDQAEMHIWEQRPEPGICYTFSPKY